MRSWVGLGVMLLSLVPLASADTPIPPLPPEVPTLPELPDLPDPPGVDLTCVTITAIPQPAEGTYVTPVAEDTQVGLLVAVNAEGTAGGLFVLLLRPNDCASGLPGTPELPDAPPSLPADPPGLPDIPDPASTTTSSGSALLP